MASVSNPEKSRFMCTVCNLDYPTAVQFEEHLWSLYHHKIINNKQPSIKHHCNLCMFESFDINEYGKHLIGEKHKASLGLRQTRISESKQGVPSTSQATNTRASENRSSINKARDQQRGPIAETSNSHQSSSNQVQRCQQFQGSQEQYGPYNTGFSPHRFKSQLINQRFPHSLPYNRWPRRGHRMMGAQFMSRRWPTPDQWQPPQPPRFPHLPHPPEPWHSHQFGFNTNESWPGNFIPPWEENDWEGNNQNHIASMESHPMAGCPSNMPTGTERHDAPNFAWRSWGTNVSDPSEKFSTERWTDCGKLKSKAGPGQQLNGSNGKVCANGSSQTREKRPNSVDTSDRISAQGSSQKHVHGADVAGINSKENMSKFKSTGLKESSHSSKKQIPGASSAKKKGKFSSRTNSKKPRLSSHVATHRKSSQCVPISHRCSNRDSETVSSTLIKDNVLDEAPSPSGESSVQSSTDRVHSENSLSQSQSKALESSRTVMPKRAVCSGTPSEKNCTGIQSPQAVTAPLQLSSVEPSVSVRTSQELGKACDAPQRAQQERVQQHSAGHEDITDKSRDNEGSRHVPPRHSVPPSSKQASEHGSENHFKPSERSDDVEVRDMQGASASSSACFQQNTVHSASSNGSADTVLSRSDQEQSAQSSDIHSPLNDRGPSSIVTRTVTATSMRAPPLVSRTPIGLYSSASTSLPTSSPSLESSERARGNSNKENTVSEYLEHLDSDPTRSSGSEPFDLQEDEKKKPQGTAPLLLKPSLPKVLVSDHQKHLPRPNLTVARTRLKSSKDGTTGLSTQKFKDQMQGLVSGVARPVWQEKKLTRMLSKVKKTPERWSRFGHLLTSKQGDDLADLDITSLGQEDLEQLLNSCIKMEDFSADIFAELMDTSNSREQAIPESLGLPRSVSGSSSVIPTSAQPTLDSKKPESSCRDIQKSTSVGSALTKKRDPLSCVSRYIKQEPADEGYVWASDSQAYDGSLGSGNGPVMSEIQARLDPSPDGERPPCSIEARKECDQHHETSVSSTGVSHSEVTSIAPDVLQSCERHKNKGRHWYKNRKGEKLSRDCSDGRTTQQLPHKAESPKKKKKKKKKHWKNKPCSIVKTHGLGKQNLTASHRHLSTAESKAERAWKGQTDAVSSTIHSSRVGEGKQATLAVDKAANSDEAILSRDISDCHFQSEQIATNVNRNLQVFSRKKLNKACSGPHQGRAKGKKWKAKYLANATTKQMKEKLMSKKIPLSADCSVEDLLQITLNEHKLQEMMDRLEKSISKITKCIQKKTAQLARFKQQKSMVIGKLSTLREHRLQILFELTPQDEFKAMMKSPAKMRSGKTTGKTSALRKSSEGRLSTKKSKSGKSLHDFNPGQSPVCAAATKNLKQSGNGRSSMADSSSQVSSVRDVSDSPGVSSVRMANVASTESSFKPHQRSEGFKIMLGSPEHPWSKVVSPGLKISPDTHIEAVRDSDGCTRNTPADNVSILPKEGSITIQPFDMGYQTTEVLQAVQKLVQAELETPESSWQGSNVGDSSTVRKLGNTETAGPVHRAECIPTRENDVIIEIKREPPDTQEISELENEATGWSYRSHSFPPYVASAGPDRNSEVEDTAPSDVKSRFDQVQLELADTGYKLDCRDLEHLKQLYASSACSSAPSFEQAAERRTQATDIVQVKVEGGSRDLSEEAAEDSMVKVEVLSPSSFNSESGVTNKAGQCPAVSSSANSLLLGKRRKATESVDEEERKRRKELPTSAPAPKTEADTVEKAPLGSDQSLKRLHAKGFVINMNIIRDKLYSIISDGRFMVFNLKTNKIEMEEDLACSDIRHAQTWQESSSGKMIVFASNGSRNLVQFHVQDKEFLQTLVLAHDISCLHVCWNAVYAGLVAGDIAHINITKSRISWYYECTPSHSITAMASALAGGIRLLVVASVNHSLTIRQASDGLLLEELVGHTHTVTQIQVVGSQVVSLASNNLILLHNIETGAIIRGIEHDVPIRCCIMSSNILAVAGCSGSIYYYNMETGKSDVIDSGCSDIECMTASRTMLFLGMKDGYIDAFPLNPSNIYKCQWRQCPSQFTTTDALWTHLRHVHIRTGIKQCLWKSCLKNYRPKGPKGTALKAITLHVMSHVKALGGEGF
ncbi:uncharacterized protein [Diadema setosum]|uniref:uncharacterized protein n=1 Tax=Diadema setosum TaxID=31175 RepID=UPI003B3B3454